MYRMCMYTLYASVRLCIFMSECRWAAWSGRATNRSDPAVHRSYSGQFPGVRCYWPNVQPLRQFHNVFIHFAVVCLNDYWLRLTHVLYYICSDVRCTVQIVDSVTAFGFVCCVFYWLLVPVQVIAWKDSSLKWSIMCREGRWTLLTRCS